MELVSNLFVHRLNFRFFVFLTLFNAAGIFGIAQNPFEMVQKRNTVIQKTDSIALLIATNPFELVESRGKPIEFTEDSRSKLEKQISSYLNIKSDPSQIKAMLFWLLLFLIFMLAIAVNLNRGLITKLYKTSFNLNLFNILYRENKEENRLVFPLLYGLYFAGLSIFIYLFLIIFRDANYSILLLIISGAVVSIYLIRHLSLKILSSIFNIGKETDHYLFNIICFGSLMAIIMIPLDFIIAFSQPGWSRKLIILGSIFFLLAYIFRQLKEILASSNLWLSSIFHFLLYLCAFEVAPLVFLYIYLQRQGWV